MFRKYMTSLLALVVVLGATAAGASAETVRTPASDGSANIRSGAGMKYAPIAWAKNGDTVEVLGTSGKWTQVKLDKNGKVGYIFTSFVDGTYTGTGSSKPAGNARIATKYASSRVNVRKSPDGAIIASLKSGASITALGKDGSWYQVRLADGTTGYVHANYVAVEAGFVTTANVNLRSGGGLSYPVIFTIPRGTSIQVNSVGASWSNVTVNGQTGYIFNKYYKAK